MGKESEADPANERIGLIAARSIKVTNVTHPYLMKAYYVDGYYEKLDKINRNLLAIRKNKGFKKFNDTKDPELGKLVIVEKVSEESNLPAWFCRGILQGFNTDTSKYKVFLVDHGIVVELLREDFAVISPKFVVDDYLTLTIGLYNIVPISLKLKDNEREVVVAKEWSSMAIKFTRALLSESACATFMPMASNGKEILFGDIFLNVEGKTMSLRKLLIVNYFAVYIGEDGSKIFTNTNDADSRETVSGKYLYDCFIEDERKSQQIISNVVLKNSNYEWESQEERKPMSKEVTKKENWEDITVHSQTHCSFLRCISDAKFPVGVHRVLEQMEVKQARKIQSYIWPAISKGLNVAAISYSGAGKTFGYIVAISALLANEKELPRGSQPTALVLCSSTSDVYRVGAEFKDILESYPEIRTVSAMNGISERSLVASMYSGSQILVSTPRFLTRFLKTNKDLLNFESLCYLVLDGADVILDKYFSELAELFRKHNIIRNREERGMEGPMLQIIVTAKQWTIPVKKFVLNTMKKPYICIGSYMEAAVFGSVSAALYIINSREKKLKALDIIEDFSMVRTMIVCNTAEEATELNDFMKSRNQKTLLAHNKMIFNEIAGVKEYWRVNKGGKYSLLICTENVLSTLQISNVVHLIHYSVTEEKKSKFHFRFSTLMHNWKKEKSKCKVSIFLDETNDVQFCGIVEIIRRLGLPVTQNLINYSQLIAATVDMRKKTYPICDNVKAFGFCPNKNFCPFRHCVLVEVDQPISEIGIGDKINLMIMHIHDATHFTARIIDYKRSNAENEIVKFSTEEYVQLPLKMNEYYSQNANRKSYKDVKVGDVSALEESIGCFVRVQVLQIVSRDDYDMPKFITVRGIDNGVIYHKISAFRLLEIPEKLRDWPIHVFEIFLTNIEPRDFEYQWNPCANEAVHEWFPKYFNEHSFIVGDVVLHLGNTIWVDTLQIGTKLINNQDVVSNSLKYELILNEHVITNDDHMKKLRRLCLNGGVHKIHECDINIDDENAKNQS